MLVTLLLISDAVDSPRPFPESRNCVTSCIPNGVFINFSNEYICLFGAEPVSHAHPMETFPLDQKPKIPFPPSFDAYALMSYYVVEWGNMQITCGRFGGHYTPNPYVRLYSHDGHRSQSQSHRLDMANWQNKNKVIDWLCAVCVLCAAKRRMHAIRVA